MSKYILKDRPGYPWIKDVILAGDRPVIIGEITGSPPTAPKPPFLAWIHIPPDDACFWDTEKEAYDWIVQSFEERMIERIGSGLRDEHPPA